MHHYFLVLLIVVYALAAVAPALGLALRSIRLGHIAWDGQVTVVTLPSIMLAMLLVNAGLGIQPRQLTRLARKPRILLAGLLANVLVPLLFILGLSLTLKCWHNPAEVQCILVGLALIASMPVAGSSTAWSQNANGDLVLSLGLVTLSTGLCPWTTPGVLHTVGWMASGEYAEALHALSDSGTSTFLLVFVMLPTVAGVALRCLLGEIVTLQARPYLKLINSVNLLVLCYLNAAIALPSVIANPDWDFLAIMVTIVFALCSLGFCAGWILAHRLKAEPSQRTALMFGLGMTNNGTGLVLAGTTLSHIPEVILPVIFYNLIQHFVAATADRLSNLSSHA